MKTNQCWFRTQCGMLALIVSLMTGANVGAQSRNLQTRSGRVPIDTQQIVDGKSFRSQDDSQALESAEAKGEMEVFTRGKALSEAALVGVTYQIHVVGEVRNPGTYRLTASDRLQEVIQRSGGITERGSKRYIQIRRRGSTNSSYDLLRFQLYGELRNNPYLLDNDVVYVPLRQKVVQVVGSVHRAQVYELKGERNLSDVIKLAGGVTSGVAANVPIRIIRFENEEKQVLEIPFDPHALRNIAVQGGDVIFVPSVIAADHQYDYNVGHIPGDEIFYPSYEDRVFVLGGVYNPGPYEFSPYGTVNQYLTIAGGTTQLAKTGKMQIINRDGVVRRVNRTDHTLKINPGDTLLVPERRLPPEAWVNIAIGIAGFGLSTTATILTLTR